jgi:hypothetical protein
MKCRNSDCQQENPSGARVCFNCWWDLPASAISEKPAPGPKIEKEDVPKPQRRAKPSVVIEPRPPSSRILDPFFGERIQFSDALVIEFVETDPIVKQHIMGPTFSRFLSFVITIGIALGLLYVALGTVSRMIAQYVQLIAPFALIFAAASYIFLGKSSGGFPFDSSIFQLPSLIVRGVFSGLLRILSQPSNSSSGSFQPHRIPVKNLQISVNQSVRLIRVEGSFIVGAISPGHRIDVTAVVKQRAGTIRFVEGYNHTLGCPLRVSAA